MKIAITNNEKDIAVLKDFSDLDKSKVGLIGQVVIELEILKQELIGMYQE